MDTIVRASLLEYRHLLAYMRASRELYEWIKGARALALLIGAVNSGVLKALRTGSTPQEIASETRLQSQMVADLCQALEAHGVVALDGERYQLSTEYALLASPQAAVPLDELIRYADVGIRTLNYVDPTDTPYTIMPPEDILTMAEGSGISSLSSSPHVSQETTGEIIPEVSAVWQTGAHHLEVGCGIGNALFGILMTYPQVTAVGIEIDELTAAETERRANILGLKDRVEIRRMDACDLADVESYDTIQWSQFFFPATTRQDVLQAMHCALKSGGYLVMPLLGSQSDHPGKRRKEILRLALKAIKSGGVTFVSFINDVLQDSPRRRKNEMRFASLLKLLFIRWGVPVHSTDQLIAEVENCGFSVLRRMFTPVNQFVLTRGFLLAKKKD